MSREPQAQTDPDGGRPMHIGEVASRTELSLRSLRHWDEVGLLRPSARTEGGFRLYTEADVEKILLIRRMKPLGFTLDQMGVAMRDFETLQRPDRSEARRGRGEVATGRHPRGRQRSTSRAGETAGHGGRVHPPAR